MEQTLFANICRIMYVHYVKLLWLFYPDDFSKTNSKFKDKVEEGWESNIIIVPKTLF